MGRDDSENAGFTSGTPWMQVNPAYKMINVKSQVDDETSIYNYYKKLIALRKAYPVIVYGSYELLYPDDSNLYVYLRRFEGKELLVICSFTGDETEFIVPKEMELNRGELLISNYDENSWGSKLRLKPYEARVYIMPN